MYQMCLEPINGCDDILESADFRTLYKIAFSEARAAGQNLSSFKIAIIYDIDRNEAVAGVSVNENGTIALATTKKAIILKERC